jgi:hypothetical protein
MLDPAISLVHIVVALALMERIEARLQIVDIMVLYAADKERSCLMKYLLFLQHFTVYSHLRMIHWPSTFAKGFGYSIQEWPWHLSKQMIRLSPEEPQDVSK